jgi:hypothetical protein
MTASTGKAALGSLFVWNNYPVAELTSIIGPNSNGETVDITNHDSPSSYREKVLGFLTPGTFEIEGNFIPTDTNGQVAMIGDHYTRDSRAGLICFPGGIGTFSFTGRIEGFRTMAPVGDKLGFTASVAVSGKPLFIGGTDVSAGLTTPFFALRDNGSNAVTPSPAAATAVYMYEASLDSGDTAIAIQPTAAAGTIKVNGTTVVSGAWSSNISVTSGGSKLLVVTVQETGKTVKVYRIWVTRPSA